MSIVGGAGPVPDRVAPEVAQGLPLHKLVTNDRWKGALTNDREGEILPHARSLWIYQKRSFLWIAKA
jgi:hypothetical protein